VSICCVTLSGSCIYLAEACRDILTANGVPPQTFSVTCTHPTSLQLGRDLPNICNVLVADLVDDAVLSGGFIPAVAHALDTLLVREDPVLVPAAVTVKAQAVALRSSQCEVAGEGADSGGGFLLDVSTLDQYRSEQQWWWWEWIVKPECLCLGGAAAGILHPGCSAPDLTLHQL